MDVREIERAKGIKSALDWVLGQNPSRTEIIAKMTYYTKLIKGY